MFNNCKNDESGRDVVGNCSERWAVKHVEREAEGGRRRAEGGGRRAEGGGREGERERKCGV